MARVGALQAEITSSRGAAGLPAPAVLGPLVSLAYLIAVSLFAVPALVFYLGWRLAKRLAAR